MTRRAALIVLAALLALLAPAATPALAADAGGWDPTPLRLSDPVDPLQGGPVVETTADGATWVAWTTVTSATAETRTVVRRVSPDGMAGPERVVLVTTSGVPQGTLALAPVSPSEVRVAYPAPDVAGTGVAVRRLGATDTGPAVFALDDADPVTAGTLKLLAAPGGATWVVSGTTMTVRRIEDGGSMGPKTAFTDTAAGSDAAVDPASGRLIVVFSVASTNGQVRAARVNAAGTIEAPAASLRAPVSSTSVGNVALAVDAAGVATAVWTKDVNPSGRFTEAVRFVQGDSAPWALSVKGAITRIDGPPGWGTWGSPPSVASDPGGASLASWLGVPPDPGEYDAGLRSIQPGSFSTASGMPAAATLGGLVGGAPAQVTDVVPGADRTFTVHSFWSPGGNSSLSSCRATRVTTTGGVVDTTILSSAACSTSVGPASAADGNVAALGLLDGSVLMSRFVTSAPACTDGASLTVAAGASVSVPLACTGWRPAREVTTAPARGTLGAIDDAAGTVNYTAGASAGSDTVAFRASNGAGASAAASVPIVVTPAPSSPAPASPTPPAVDRTPPVISKVALSPALVVRTAPRTPTLRFTLSEPARVTVTLERTVAGRRVGGSCRTGRKRRAGARCQVVTLVSRLTRQAPAGPAKLAIGVTRAGGVLRAGSYRLTIAARDATGNAAAVKRIGLTVAAR